MNTVNLVDIDLVTELKTAMRYLPSGVALLTTRDPETGESIGMAISSAISVSMNPPSMLVAVNTSSAAHTAIKKAGQFCINLLNVEDKELVGIFSSSARKEERFKQDSWFEKHQLDYLDGATSLFCKTSTSVIFGTHELFIGEVFDVIQSQEPQPLGWLKGDFHQMLPL